MAKPTKKQLRHAEKRRKERALRRRELQIIGRAPALEPRRPRNTSEEQPLRDHLLKFAYLPRFKRDSERALNVYFGERLGPGRTLTMDEAEAATFEEWHINDFVTAEHERIIDLFAREVGPSLPPNQLPMLEDWRRTNRMRLMEIQDVTPGVGETAQDLFSGEVYHMNDISMSRAAKRWQVVMARTLLTAGRWHFTGGGRLFTPMEKDTLLDFARNLLDEYRRTHPAASVDDFYRDRSLALEQYAPPPPHFITPEGHDYVGATAEYRARDRDEIMRRLDQTEEFNYAGRDARARDSEHYNWLLRGCSFVPEQPDALKKGLTLQSEWTLGPGHPSYRSLGDVVIAPHRLELSCVSRERLLAGKALLADLLGDLIVHQHDRFKDLETMLAEHRDETPRSPTPRVARDVSDALVRKMLDDATRDWLDNPHPSFGNQTPREAMRTPEGRAAVEESLKAIEYLQAEKAEQGEPYMDARAIRRELGLL
ncbi:MAG: MbcA/ParS/Xre antitoxin family protein [Chloroflexota bacterium]